MSTVSRKLLFLSLLLFCCAWAHAMVPNGRKRSQSFSEENPEIRSRIRNLFYSTVIYLDATNGQSLRRSKSFDSSVDIHALSRSHGTRFSHFFINFYY